MPPRSAKAKLRVKQHDKLRALALLSRILGMLINRSEISCPAGKPVEIDHTIDHSARIRSRLDEIANRLPAYPKQPMTIHVRQPGKPRRAPRWWHGSTALGSPIKH